MSSLRVHLARIKHSGIKKFLKFSDWVLDEDRLVTYVNERAGYNDTEYVIKDGEINFLHIPKTGGTSLCRLLERDPGRRFRKLNIHRPVSKKCPPETHKYITVIREPVSRVWSLYQMNLKRQANSTHQKWARRGLEVFMSKWWEARNMTCKYLSGCLETEPNEEILALALENLKHFHAVFDFRNFSKEVSQFLTRYEVPFDEIPNERNHSYDRPDKSDIELIKKYNSWDIALYEQWVDFKKSQ